MSALVSPLTVETVQESNNDVGALIRGLDALEDQLPGWCGNRYESESIRTVMQTAPLYATGRLLNSAMVPYCVSGPELSWLGNRCSLQFLSRVSRSLCGRKVFPTNFAAFETFGQNPLVDRRSTRGAAEFGEVVDVDTELAVLFFDGGDLELFPDADDCFNSSAIEGFVFDAVAREPSLLLTIVRIDFADAVILVLKDFP